MRSACPDRYYVKPVMPKLPPNVFEVLPFSLDKKTELMLPEFPREENRMVEDMMTEEEQPVLFSFGYLSAVNAQSLTQLCERETLREYCKSGKVIFVKNICLARIVPRIGLIVHASWLNRL
eukprot:s18_g23.t1